jgi:hypothetical protein
MFMAEHANTVGLGDIISTSQGQHAVFVVADVAPQSGMILLPWRQPTRSPEHGALL